MYVKKLVCSDNNVEITKHCIAFHELDIFLEISGRRCIHTHTHTHTHTHNNSQIVNISSSFL